ncbi:MAG: hypothetical protein ACRDPW_06180 [Mycobacteriales bacterium]
MGKHIYSADHIEFGPDVNPAVDEIYDNKGARIDQAYVDRAIAESIQYSAEPSLYGEAAAVSPPVSFQLGSNVRELAEQRARKEGKTLSGLAREALENYLNVA